MEQNLMTRSVSITVNIDIARKMLNVAGYSYNSLKSKSDEEIFFQALSMCEEYGVKVLENHE
ncbi:MAG: hypothetical protein IJZ79_03520 [Bacilli bacterium]|nr:hypothetical protein [Bacilli bacterium]MBQ8218798.1 hypothetical protein [Bacilli bacterium]